MLDVSGDEAFVLLAKTIAKSGDARKWRGELRNALRRITRPTIREAKRNAKAILPRRGGLGSWVARATIKTQIVTTGSDVGVVIKGGLNKRNGKADVRRIDEGSVAHKNWGRPPWRKQAVAPGWFTKTIDGPTTDRLGKEVDDVVMRILREIG